MAFLRLDRLLYPCLMIVAAPVWKRNSPFFDLEWIQVQIANQVKYLFSGNLYTCCRHQLQAQFAIGCIRTRCCRLLNSLSSWGKAFHCCVLREWHSGSCRVILYSLGGKLARGSARKREAKCTKKKNMTDQTSLLWTLVRRTKQRHTSYLWRIPIKS